MKGRKIALLMTGILLLTVNTSVAVEQKSIYCVESVRGNPLTKCQQQCADSFLEEDVDSYLREGWSIVRSVPVEETVEATWTGSSGGQYGCVCVGTRYTLQRSGSAPSQKKANEVDGFRGVKWGSSIFSVKGLDYDFIEYDMLGDKTGSSSLSKEAAKTNIGGAELMQVRYFFDVNKKFYGVSGMADYRNPRKNGLALLKSFIGKYGEPDKVVDDPKGRRTNYFWIGKTTAILVVAPEDVSHFKLVDSSTSYAQSLLNDKTFTAGAEKTPDGL